MSPDPQPPKPINVTRVKETAELFFAAVLTVYAVYGFHLLREQLDLMSLQIAITQNQILENTRSEHRSRQDIDRALANSDSQAVSLAALACTNQTLADANADISKSAKESAKAAKTSAANSGKALMEADRHLQITLKPNLVPFGIYGNTAKEPVVFNTQTDTTLYIYLKNTGHSLASARDFACGLFGPNTPPIVIECPRMLYDGTHVYGVGDENWVTVVVPKLSSDDLSALEKGQKRLKVFFGATYVDQ